VRCDADALTELDARETARWSLLLYHVDPKPPPLCSVAGPRTATAGGSMRKPGTLSSSEL
jgi:hypothetical protein